ncbi:MAG: hypothetical protein HZB24_02555 [Desulfobacterales bacterium]|nr:hypothetical protein [Desulfobacterales bacterium]
MSYREEQRRRAVAIRDALFKDPGTGLFFGKQRDFVLKDPSLNLWAGIRDDAKHYFATHRIPWWKGTASDPTGHLLSSQVACLNHLYFLRQRKEIATAVLKALDPTIQEALPVDTGYVAFEYIGTRPYLKEKAFTRGANCTSIDAVMLGSTADNQRVLFLIEWKYTEYYAAEDLYIPRRAGVYDPLIISAEGPFVSNLAPRSLYFEPFYQMMRQTLLAWQFEKHGELDCSRCVNVHVIPRQNKELKETIATPGLSGRNIHDAWQKVLKAPEKYIACDPSEMLNAARDLPDTKSWLAYLKARYW